MNDKKILGIDPSIASTGYAVIDKGKLIACGKITTSSKHTETFRMHELFEAIRDIVQEFQPDITVMEDQFMGVNAQTSLYLARARGVAMISAYEAGSQIVIYTPSEIKKCVTGIGNSKKDLVQEKVIELYKDAELVDFYFSQGIKSNGKNKNDDISDAIAIAHTHKVLNQGKLI